MGEWGWNESSLACWMLLDLNQRGLEGLRESRQIIVYRQQRMLYTGQVHERNGF